MLRGVWRVVVVFQLTQLTLQKLLRPLLCGSFFDTAGKTAYEALRELTDNEDLIAVLCGQFGDYGPPPKEASFFSMKVLVHVRSVGEAS